MVLPRSDFNLILTGYTGPNQPIIGEQVANRLKMRFVNVDGQIESRAGMEIDDVRARYGESWLKTVESEIMGDILLHRGAVIRVSGQTLLHGEYIKRLQERGFIVCLVVTLDAVLQRLHLALGGRYHNPHERALEIGHLRREWAVRSLEGIRELDVTYLNEEQTVDAVTGLWQRIVTGSPLG
jgi:shikimate kinase